MHEQIITIERHIIEQQRRHPEAAGVLSNLLRDIALAAKIIARETSRAGLVEILGLTGKTNVQGEQQMKLDIFANVTMTWMNCSPRACTSARRSSSAIGSWLSGRKRSYSVTADRDKLKQGSEDDWRK